MNCMNQKVSFNKLVESNFKYTYISESHLEYLDYNMSLTLNNLEKRKERNVSRHSLYSNNPIFDKRSCIT